METVNEAVERVRKWFDHQIDLIRYYADCIDSSARRSFLRLQAALGSGFSLQAAFWYQNAMLAPLPRSGESLTPRQKAGQERREFDFLFLIDAFVLLWPFKSVLNGVVATIVAMEF